MKKNWPQFPVTITFIISVLLFLSGLYLLRHWYNDLSSLPLSDMRNVGLVLFALAGIPFLILGHKTRTADLKVKQSDFLLRSNDVDLRTDGVLFDSLGKSLVECRSKWDSLNKVIDASIVDRNKTIAGDFDLLKAGQNTDDRTLINNYLEARYIQGQMAVDKEQLIDKLENWSEFSNVSLMLASTISISMEIQSNSIKRISTSNILSSFDQESLMILYFIALIFDDSKANPIHSNVYGTFFNSDESGKLLSDSFFESLKTVNRKYSKSNYISR